MVSSVGVSDEIREQLVALACRSAGRALGPLLVAVALAFLLLTEHGPRSGAAIWAGITCAVIVGRFLLLRALRDASRLSLASRIRVVAVLNLCLGGALGAVLLFFPDTDLFERAMMSLLLVGISSGVIGSNLGHTWLFTCFVLPMLGPLTIFWIANPGTVADRTLSLIVGIGILMMIVAHLRMAREVFDVFVLSIESSRALGTQAVRLEEQAERLSHALEGAESARREAEASDASKTRFIAAASHDLRQPVHVLNLYGAALEKIGLEPKAREIVGDMGVAVASLAEQLESLLDLSKLDGESAAPELRAVDLAAVTRSLTSEFGALADERGITFVDAVEAPLHVLSDRAMLTRILRNLCGNAIDFTPAGSVTLSAEVRGESVTLSIADTGIGIEKEDRARVFEEFYQVSNAGRDRRRGSGLGLSIVDRLARRLGHELTLHSSPGVGTRVGVSMRRARVDDGHPVPARSAADRAPEPLPADHWIHVVDDDPVVRRSMRVMLETLGAKVTTASSTAETLERLAGRTPSAVLIDLRLGDDDSGLHTVDALRRSHPGVPLAIVTGEPFVEPEVASRYPELLVLHKPVPETELLELLGFMLGHPSGAAERRGELV